MVKSRHVPIPVPKLEPAPSQITPLYEMWPQNNAYPPQQTPYVYSTDELRRLLHATAILRMPSTEALKIATRGVCHRLPVRGAASYPSGGEQAKNKPKPMGYHTDKTDRAGKGSAGIEFLQGGK